MRIIPVANLTGQMPYQKHAFKRKIKPRAEANSPWAVYGSDDDYQAFCRKRPSAYSGHNGNIVFAHYRTAANSGTGCKPFYSGIPLTSTEHAIQHRIGQYNFMEKSRWEYLVELHLKMWAATKQLKN